MSTKMISLSGNWKIVRDAGNLGKQNEWYCALPDEEVHDITVPGYMSSREWAMNYSYSNVFPGYHGVVWYYKNIEALPDMSEGERCLLEFDRAGYLCEVYVNGKHLGEHRHHEERFSFDITDVITTGGNNLVAVRCFEPRATGDAIDGIKLAEIPNGVWADSLAVLPGVADDFCMECFGGITGEVRLRAVGEVCIDDVYVRTDIKSGEVRLAVTLINYTNLTCKKDISVCISEQKRGTSALKLGCTVDVGAGKTETVICGKIIQHSLWTLDNPVLYVADVEVHDSDRQSVRFGFKDFRIENGFFFLNGKRILIKGSHAIASTSNVISMKAMGFNMIRSIHRAFTKEVLDVCDEIGMLVMESTVTAWGMHMHSDTQRMINDYTGNMVKMHRNHPCIAAYYIFNELRIDSGVYDCGVKSLPYLRSLAPDALFMISSGRWDNDIMTGSASNPGSDTWNVYLGSEGIENTPNREFPVPMDGCRDAAVGDMHLYMYVPADKATRNFIRTVGSSDNPVFVSESGVASQGDPMGSYLLSGKRKLLDVITVDTVKHVWNKVDEFLDFYDLRSIYPLACEISKAADRLNGAQRELFFNMYRSNPKINGYSLTSFGTGNEGTLEGNYVIKESLAHVIQEGLEPLRWALFSEEKCVYANKPFEVEAVLCNEDVLSPGTYAAKVFITNGEGCVWTKDFDVVYPEYGYGNMPPLAMTVLKDKVCLPEGEYTFSARLLEGGYAFGGDLKIKVAKPLQKVNAEVGVWGLPDDMVNFLNSNGVCTKDITKSDFGNIPRLIIAGKPEPEECGRVLKQLKGCNVFFADVDFFEENPELLKTVAGENAVVKNAPATIYRHDHIAVKNPVFKNISAPGVMDIDTLGTMCPQKIIAGTCKPDFTLCASVRIESVLCSYGVALGEFNSGNGKCILSAFEICNTIGTNPLSDLLLMNIVDYYGK